MTAKGRIDVRKGTLIDADTVDHQAVMEAHIDVHRMIARVGELDPRLRRSATWSSR